MNKKLVWLYFLVLFIYRAPVMQAQPAPCTATDGPGIAKCVEQAYPEKLKANVTLAERTANATFLRDRVIETARCAKLDVGLNLKRGGPSISVDFIAWKNGSVTEGVDIIGGWDDLKRTLSLGWHRYKAPDFGFPTYKAYGPVSCIGQPVPPMPEPPPAPPVDTELQKKIAAIDQELAFHKSRLTLLEQENSNQAVLINTLNDVIATLTSQLEALKPQIAELQSRQIPSGCSVQFGLRCRLQ